MSDLITALYIVAFSLFIVGLHMLRGPRTAVRGNLVAGEQILIRRTATMLGNLTAPRVGLEDGCCFKGSVDMEMRADTPRASMPAPKPAEAPKPALATSPAPVKLETAPARP